MLGRRRRRWYIIKPVIGKRLVLTEQVLQSHFASFTAAWLALLDFKAMSSRSHLVNDVAYI